jgi:ureidoglycolate dehydrogenase (NAD+)
MPLFDGGILSEVMRGTLAERKVSSESVHHVVSSLVQTSLRGVDSHGINLFPHYCRAVVAGRVNGNPRMTIDKTGESAAVVDADHAFGHHAGAVAMDLAIELGKKSGVGAVSVRNSTHFGAAAYFGLRAPEKDCLGFAFTNADALVKAFGARQAFFGTNPICFTAPMEREGPYCLDMATSLVSWNKIKNHRREKKPIPAHWAFDEEGNGVTDPDSARTLNPVGEYKGFGLGMMIDILCGALAGGPMNGEILPMFIPPLNPVKRRLSHFFVAVDISRFIDPSVFKNIVQGVADRIRILPPLDAHLPVMVAGDPEKKMYGARVASGIPVHESISEEFFSLSPLFRKAILP